MRHVLTVILVSGLGVWSATRASGAEPWWNLDFACRVAVSAAAPAEEAADGPVKVKVDFPSLLKRAGVTGDFDPNSIRIVESRQATPIPFQFNTDDGRTGTLWWEPSGGPRRRRTFFIYCDGTAAGAKSPPEIAAVRGAGNPVRNASFEAPDPTDDKRAAGWDFANLPPDAALRTDEDSHSGRHSLRIRIASDKPDSIWTAIWQHVPAREGRMFQVRAWVKVQEAGKGMASGVWCCFDLPSDRGIDNYKTYALAPPDHEGWVQVVSQGVYAHDVKKNEVQELRSLLPGTLRGRVEACAGYGNGTIYVDDLEYVEVGPPVPATPREAVLGKPERRP